MVEGWKWQNVNFPQIIVHQTPNLSHTFTVNFAMFALQLRCSGIKNHQNVYYKMVILTFYTYLPDPPVQARTATMYIIILMHLSVLSPRVERDSNPRVGISTSKIVCWVRDMGNLTFTRWPGVGNLILASRKCQNPLDFAPLPLWSLTLILVHKHWMCLSLHENNLSTRPKIMLVLYSLLSQSLTDHWDGQNCPS